MPETKELSPRRQQAVKRKIRRRRWQILDQIQGILEAPMVVLSFVWIFLVIANMVSPNPAFLGIMGVIWYIFIADFFVRAAVAPSKREFIKHNWLSAIGIFLPAARAFQIFSFLNSIQALSMLSGNTTLLVILSGVNRSMGALNKLLRRRSTGYVLGLTMIVIFAGAAGIYNMERGVVSPIGIHSYPQALYWTTMLVTTIGSDYWPQTPQGKTLCVCLSLYAIGILGYVAGTLASFFIGKDAQDEEGEIAGERELRLLKAEVCELRRDIRELINRQTGRHDELPRCPTGELPKEETPAEKPHRD